MEAKCPMCGAPMEHNCCGYCGYKEKVIQNFAVEPVQTEQTFAQPQVVIHNQIVAPPGVIPGISKKSKMVALLLCIFVGWLGIHRFYVGKVGTGILYLFTGGLLGIGWIVDIIVIAAGSFRDQFNLPLKQ